MSHRDTIETYWAAADARDWDRFADTLADDVVYTIEQTRERITGKPAYVRFNREYPGNWRIEIVRIVADADGGFSWTRFIDDDGTVSALSIFDFDADGRIRKVDDFWPEPYDAPPGREHLVERY